MRLWRLPAFRNAYAVRGLVVWAGIRVAAAFTGMGRPNVAAAALILMGVAAAVLLDARRRDEDLFLANLGISAWAVAVWSLPLAVVAEALVP